MAHSLIVRTVDIHQLAAIVRNRIDNALILDGRSFLEYNSSHIVNAINVGCAKLMKRRLQQEKLCIEDFLAQNCHWNVNRNVDIIVYDQNTCDPRCLPPDSFMGVFLQKLLPVYGSVNLLEGGFLEFQAAYPDLCEDERSKFAPLTSLSQPCLPVTNHGPTRILPFLYLGSQMDALNKEVLQHYNITYQLNVSTNCPKPDFILESNFMRIPVIDNYSEKLLPHFHNAFQFLDKARESGCCVLIHCLAGISRSATVAIAYVMKTLRMTSDEAYRYVKGKRASVSPNFNFLGQLLEYEKQLQSESVIALKTESSVTPLFNSSSQNCKQTCYKDSYVSVEKNFQCSPQKNNSNGFCIRYADDAESGSHISEEKSSSASFRKNINETTVAYNHIPCKQSSATLNIKCLPVSSLKELNFTPCQTSCLKSVQYWKSNKNTKDALRIVDCVRSPNLITKTDPTSPKRLENKRNASSIETNPLGKSESMCSLIAMSPGLISPDDLKAFEFDTKTYSRSDSVSTSGIGSEGSDCADSWNDFTSSCERETDISMDDDYSSVPYSEGMLRMNKMGSDRVGFEDSYEDSLSFYPKYESYNTQHEVQHDYAQTVPTAKMKLKLSKYEDVSFHENSLHHVLNPSDYGKTNLLYRAQSCPGMLSTELSSLQNGGLEKIGSGNVKLRKSKTKFSEDKNRNRYSCSSIDYMDYSQNTNFSHEICPDAVHLGSGSKNPTISSSHCNYRHSMIQVS